jgi:hypothetical protein
MGPPPPDPSAAGTSFDPSSLDAGPPPDPNAPPDDTGATTDTGQQYSNSLEALDGAEEALQAFIQLDPDEADRAEAAKCLQSVIKLKASNQTSAQSGDMKSFQRSLLSGPAGVGGPGGAGPMSGY